MVVTNRKDGTYDILLSTENMVRAVRRADLRSDGEAYSPSMDCLAAVDVSDGVAAKPPPGPGRVRLSRGGPRGVSPSGGDLDGGLRRQGGGVPAPGPAAPSAQRRRGGLRLADARTRAGLQEHKEGCVKGGKEGEGGEAEDEGEEEEEEEEEGGAREEEEEDDDEGGGGRDEGGEEEKLKGVAQAPRPRSVRVASSKTRRMAKASMNKADMEAAAREAAVKEAAREDAEKKAAAKRARECAKRLASRQKRKAGAVMKEASRARCGSGPGTDRRVFKGKGKGKRKLSIHSQVARRRGSGSGSDSDGTTDVDLTGGRGSSHSNGPAPSVSRRGAGDGKDGERANGGSEGAGTVGAKPTRPARNPGGRVRAAPDRFCDSSSQPKRKTCGGGDRGGDGGEGSASHHEVEGGGDEGHGSGLKGAGASTGAAKPAPRSRSPGRRLRAAPDRFCRSFSQSFSQPAMKKARRETQESSRPLSEKYDEGEHSEGGGFPASSATGRPSFSAAAVAGTCVNAPSGLEIAAHVEGVGVWNDGESDSSEDDGGASRKRRPKAIGAHARGKPVRRP